MKCQVIVTGDFNEPSHLDWTERYASEGADRWTENPTATSMRFAIPRPGSIRLHELGLRDAWRSVYPDEVADPGNTWTPTYPPDTPGRRPPGDQINDRIDMIYFSASPLTATESHVIGESEEFSTKQFDGPWPSDHRAVFARFVQAGNVK